MIPHRIGRSLAVWPLVPLLVVAAGCGSGSGGGGGGGSASGSPYTIGLLATLSGGLAQVGKDTQAGAEVAVTELNAAGGVSGHPLQLSTKDEQGSATATVSAMREFADAGVGVVIGGTVTPDCLAANPIAEQNNIAFISSACNDIALTTTNRSANYFQVSPSTLQYANAAAQYVQQQYPTITTWDAAAYDYDTGHAFWTNFKAALSAREPSVAYGATAFFPLTATQFGPYLSTLTSAAPAGGDHGLFSFSFGAGAISFYQQGASYQLSQHFKTILAIAGSEPTSKAMGADGPQLDYVYDYYYSAYQDNTMNTKFVGDYATANNGAKPDSWAYEGYTAVLAAAAGMQKAGSSNGGDVVKALPGVHFGSPKGDVYFRDQDHALVSPATAFTCKGDSSAAAGYSCPHAVAIPASGTLPAAT